MLRALMFAGATMAGLSPALAGNWSVGVGVGIGPGYYAPPPVYYGRPYYRYRHPRLYGPPVVVYEEPPVIYEAVPEAPAALPADAVFNALEQGGYHDFGPMAFRDGVYKLQAVNRSGDRVALEVSALDAAVISEFVIGANAVAPPPRRENRPRAEKSGDPLVVY